MLLDIEKICIMLIECCKVRLDSNQIVFAKLNCGSVLRPPKLSLSGLIKNITSQHSLLCNGGEVDSLPINCLCLKEVDVLKARTTQQNLGQFILLTNKRK